MSNHREGLWGGLCTMGNLRIRGPRGTLVGIGLLGLGRWGRICWRGGWGIGRMKF